MEVVADGSAVTPGVMALVATAGVGVELRDMLVLKCG